MDTMNEFAQASAGREIIAITGAKRSGKDTLGRHISALLGHEPMAFADPIRQILLDLNPLMSGPTSLAFLIDAAGGIEGASAERIHGGEVDYLYTRFRDHVLPKTFTDGDFSDESVAWMLRTLDPFVGGTVTLRDVIDAHAGDWDSAKDDRLYGREVRALMQRLGTDVMRCIYDENVWVDLLARRASANKIVITDLRFPNEAEWVRSQGGRVVKVIRDGLASNHASNHASEQGIPDNLVDIVVENDGVSTEAYLRLAEVRLFGE